MCTTICAISTAQGGAIGIVRVSGPQAIKITNAIFQGRHSLLDAPGYSVHYGQIFAPSETGQSSSLQWGERSGSVIDDVLVTIFRAPRSYTGEDSVEISCHGSSFILQNICQLLISQGCKQAAPGEYTQRAFLNGKLDLSQAEAVADLIAAQNAASHHVAMSQLRGSISTKLSKLHDKLLHLTSLLELELDFSDHEDLTFASRPELLSIAQSVEQEIRRLSASYTQGNAIKNGMPVAIIGAPNTGKSTLLNAILQEDKAIVSDIQGTTRDTIEDTITIDGKLFRFIDTAGIRKTTDKIESMGIDRSIKAAERAQIIILMRDPDHDYPTLSARPDQTIIHVFNKSDLINNPITAGELSISAKNSQGIDTLKRHLLSVTPSEDYDAAIITSLRHKQALDQSAEDIARAITALQMNISGDIIAEDLRQCIYHLSVIIGRDLLDPSTTLNSIFSHFCIGK